MKNTSLRHYAGGRMVFRLNVRAGRLPSLEGLAAARWWTDQLVPSTATKSSDPVALMSRKLTEHLREDIHPATLAMFEDGLARRIDEMPATRIGAKRLSVDYEPDDVLEFQARKHRIDPDAFPIKTNMIIRPGRVEVSQQGVPGVQVVYSREVEASGLSGR